MGKQETKAIAMDDFRVDGEVMNQLLKLGDQFDLDTHSRPGNFAATRLTPEELEDLFLDPICERVCTLVYSLIRASGFRVELDSFGSSLEDRKEKKSFQGKMSNAIRSSKLLPMLWEASVLSAVYPGGSAVILDIDDNVDTSAEARPNWDQPVNWGHIKSVKALFALSSREIRPETHLPTLGRPRLFKFNLTQGQGMGEIAQGDDERAKLDRERAAIANEIANRGLSSIHEDRILWVEGIYTPPRALQRYQGGIGRLERFWPSYSRYVAALGAASNLLHRSEIIEIANDGWLDTLRAVGTPEGRKKLRDEISTVMFSLTNLGVLVRDRKKSEVKVIKRSTGGFSQMINNFKQDMISKSGLTEMHLFGLTTVSGGLSGTDWRDRMHLELQCKIRRESEWKEPIEKFLLILFKSKDGPTKGKEPDGWRIEFNSSLAMTPMEEADLRSKQAGTDKIYAADLGLPKPDILFSRFDGPYSAETTLMDPEGLIESLKAAEEAAAAEAQGQGMGDPGMGEDDGGEDYAEGFEDYPEGDLDALEAELAAEFQIDSADDKDRLDEWASIATELHRRGHKRAAREVQHHIEAMGLMTSLDRADRAGKSDAYEKLATALYRKHPFFAGQILGHAAAEKAGAMRGDSKPVPFQWGDRFEGDPVLDIGELEELVNSSIAAAQD